jgi:chemotaxis protein CheX
LAPARPAFTADDVRAVTRDVWEACLASAGEPLEDGTPGPLEGEVVLAQIRIAGGWSGAVTLEMSSAAATAAARVMLDARAVDPDEVADAVGELVNIIGGNLKSLVPTPSRLSLPGVSRSPEPEDLVGVTEQCRLDLGWGTRPVRVRVWT